MENPNESYFNKRIYSEIGLSENDLITHLKVNSRLVEKKVLYPDENDNICILVFDINRNILEVDHPLATPNSPSVYNNRTQNLVIKRLKKTFHDKEGNEIRYLMPKNSGSHPLPSISVIEKFEKEEKIDTLILTEGFLKMFSLAKHKVDVIALSSITHYKDKETQTLHTDILKVIEKCEVKNVIMLYDGDCFNISEKALKTGDDLVKRPLIFYSSIKKIGELLKDTQVHFYFGYINSSIIEGKPKGIDDLLITYNNHVNEIIADLMTFGSHGKFIQKIDLTESIDDLKVFYPLQDVKRFYEKYKNDIRTNPFIFNGNKYQYNPEKKTIARLISIGGIPVVYSDELRFWDKTKNHKGEYTDKLAFNYEKAYNFLQENGYFKHKSIFGQYSYKRQIGNIIYDSNPQEIKDFTNDFLKVLGDKKVLNMLYRGNGRYLGQNSITNIITLEPDFTKNGPEKQYMFFENKVIEITSKGVFETSYSDLSLPVSSSQIRSQKIKILPEIIELIQNAPENIHENITKVVDLVKNKFQNSHFFQYLIDTSNIYWEKEEKQIPLSASEIEEQNTHLLNKISALGYLAHSYRDNSKAYAVIGVDNEISEVGESQGGTGKSVFGFALDLICNLVYIPGKSTKLTDNPHIWQNVTETTNIIFIDDVRLGFDFEFLYPIITGKMLVNPKGTSSFYIPENKTPKVYITTNHAIKSQNRSDERRQFTIAFSDYFNKNRTPKSKFGTNFYSEDWNSEQWNLFYNTAIVAVFIYLRYGKIEAPSLNIKKRENRQLMGESFFAWAEDYFTNKENLNSPLDKKELYDVYNCSGYDKNKSGSIVLFKKRLKAYAEYKNFLFNKDKNGTDDKRNGAEYITLSI